MEGLSLDALRKQFRQESALGLAAQLDLPGLVAVPPSRALSTRFAFLTSPDSLVVVVGKQEADPVKGSGEPGSKGGIDLALAHGLHVAGKARRLTLVLPAGHTMSTTQRAAWFPDHCRPRIYSYDSTMVVAAVEMPSRQQTVERLHHIKPGLDANQELEQARVPVHHGKNKTWVDDLVEWATHHADLDAGHTQGDRSWHFRGQRVLRIQGARTLTITAGIDAGKKPAFKLRVSHPMTKPDLATVRKKVEEGIAQRSSSTQYAKPDEHWLQAVLRRDPARVGIEQPALREVPAWRPMPAQDHWGRGFLDLVGLDGHGDIRLVETKLAENDDALFVLQGLDYLIWATACKDALVKRLGASPQAELVVHYVLGATPTGRLHMSSYARTHAELLAEAFPFRFQIVRDWFDPAATAPASAPAVSLLPAGELPSETP